MITSKIGFISGFINQAGAVLAIHRGDTLIAFLGLVCSVVALWFSIKEKK